MGTIYKSGIPYSGGGEYTAGNGIDITGNEIAVDDTVVATKADLADKQDTLTAGDNITIENNTISADDEVFVAVYEQTSYADVKAAIDAHKAIVLDMPANNNQFCITFSTYTNGGNALMYAIYKMNDKPTLMTVTLTPQNQWTTAHTDLQDKLISGTSIKTINNTSLLGSGNIDAGREEFIAIIESTSFADVKAAIDANKFIILQETANKTRIPSTTVVSNNSITFGTTNGNTLSRVTVNNNDVWTVTNIPMSGKQDTLVSGENIKTINSLSLLGNGDIDVSDIFVAEMAVTPYEDILAAINAGKQILFSGSSGYTFVPSAVRAMSGYIVLRIVQHSTPQYVMKFVEYRVTQGVTQDAGWTVEPIATMQPLLESGTNIKTINNASLLGGGNIDIQGGIDLEIGAEKWYGTYTEAGVTYQVYSKVLKIDALPATAGIANYPHGITGIKQILCAYGFGTNGFVLNAPRQNAQDNIAIYQVQKASGGSVAIEVGKDRSNMGAYVCLVYAKNN